MVSVNFYHLNKTNTYFALCKLLEKAIRQGERVLVKTNSKDATEELDEFLWSYDQTSFLPHGKLGDISTCDNPIFITNEIENLNNACYLFIVSNSNFTISEISQFQRAFILFNKDDKDFIDVARKLWVDTAALNFERKYWVEEREGWVLKVDT